MIRTKKIKYLESPAIAIYFQNMTQHVKQLRLESLVLQEKNKTQQLENYTSTISHEFRTPLGTSLMFLENLMQLRLGEDAMSLINLVVSQLNLLLCLVNDVLDIKMIQSQKFQTKVEKFNPVKDVLEFIVAMFNPQAQMQQTLVTYEVVTANDFQDMPTIKNSLLAKEPNTVLP